MKFLLLTDYYSNNLVGFLFGHGGIVTFEGTKEGTRISTESLHQYTVKETPMQIYEGLYPKDNIENIK